MKRTIRHTLRRFAARLLARQARPFFFTTRTLGRQRLRFMTHGHDDVLGGMLRGEAPVIRHFRVEIAWIEAQLRPGDFILDAGGNLGAISVTMARAQPEARIVAFEPDPLNFALLQANLALNGCRNVHAFNFALGREEGLIRFYRSPDNFGDHRSSAPAQLGTNEAEFQALAQPVLKVRASDFLRRAFPEARINLAKIDTQGADFDILEDILPLLAPGAQVTIEYSPYHLHDHGTTREDVARCLGAFRRLHILREDPHAPFALEPADLGGLLRYFDAEHAAYRGYLDLVLGK